MGYDERQANAENFIDWVFDDDLDSSSGGNQFGAGPLVTFSGGAGDPAMVASQRMEVDTSNPVHKPNLIRQSESPNTFSIELRRGAVDASDASLVSNGPPLPYLFARGSLMNRNAIAKGIAVRAKAAAIQAPAVRIGLSTTVFSGSIPLAYEVSEWGTSPTNPKALLSTPTKIGEAVSLNGTGNPNQEGYCAVYSNISGVNRVIGFGWLGTSVPVVEEGVVAKGNATARLSEAWSELGALSPSDRTAVIDANRTFKRPLLAPVSGR